MADSHTPTDNPMLTGIKGRCPRCQQDHLFKGFLSMAKSCEVCGLDYSFADPADGPGFFAITIAIVPALAFALDAGEIRSAALGTCPHNTALDRGFMHAAASSIERLAGLLPVLP